jgi:hypothetical protein
VLDFLCSAPIVAATTGFIRCLPGHSDGVIENVWSRKTLSTAVENYYIVLKENYIRYYQFSRVKCWINELSLYYTIELLDVLNKGILRDMR